MRISALTRIIFIICFRIGKYVKYICISRGQYFLRFHSTYDLELRNSLCHGVLNELHCTILVSLFVVLKITQMDWSPSVPSFWRACSNPCQKYVGENYTTTYFVISPPINLKVANFIERTWLIHHSTNFWKFLDIQQGFSSRSVFIRTGWHMLTDPEPTSGNFFLFSCLTDTHFHCSRKQLLLLERVFTSSVHSSGSCLSQNTHDPDSDVWRFLSYTKATFLYILQNWQFFHHKHVTCSPYLLWVYIYIYNFLNFYI